jgi:predicted lipoprotein with Yx(FWY)xxD motif
MSRVVRHRLSIAVVSALAGVLLSATMALGASPGPTVTAVNNPNFGSIVANGKGQSLYLLTTESGAKKFSCTGVCTIFWPPLTVSSATAKLTAGPGVAGQLGVVKRPEGTYQVTYNGYPVYTYWQDSGHSTQGQGVQSFGGTWYLMSATATTPATTAVKHHS